MLERGAPVHTKDDSYGGTPLGWALYGWANSVAAVRRGRFYETVAYLARAGAKLELEWFAVDDRERRRTIRKLDADPRMQAATRGEISA